ncbi:hypothetical protein PIB30_005086 [Stylosanthes scabra]|uniref:Uncharacterized protein n=1 Tax=Stylosanthes scabra TaxID=79078 RepID=A0ABU6Q4P8_9FABA|nr:hypothetical protein [Stylosanthes scabra]
MTLVEKELVLRACLISSIVNVKPPNEEHDRGIVVRTGPNRPVGPVQPRIGPIGSSKAKNWKCIQTGENRIKPSETLINLLFSSQTALCECELSSHNTQISTHNLTQSPFGRSSAFSGRRRSACLGHRQLPPRQSQSPSRASASLGQSLRLRRASFFSLSLASAVAQLQHVLPPSPIPPCFRLCLGVVGGCLIASTLQLKCLAMLQLMFKYCL